MLLFFFFLTEKAEKEITHFLCKLILLRYRTAQLQGRFPGAGSSGAWKCGGAADSSDPQGAGPALGGGMPASPQRGHADAPALSSGWGRPGTPLSLALPRRPPRVRARAQGKAPLTFGAWDAQAASWGKSLQALSPASPRFVPRSGAPYSRAGRAQRPRLACRYFPDPTEQGQDHSTRSCPRWRERCVPVALSILSRECFSEPPLQNVQWEPLSSASRHPSARKL